MALRRSVEERTWETWALEHHKFWQSVLPPTLSLGVLPLTPIEPQQTANVHQPITAIPCCASAPERNISGRKLKILIVARNELLTGGPAVRIPILQQILKKHGHVVDISYDPAPDPTGYDVTHVFNAWVPMQALGQMRHLKKFSVPVVLSPIFLDLSEMVWASRAQKLIFAPTVDAENRLKFLEALANGSLMLDNRSRAQGIEIFPGANAMLREIISLADHIICLSIEEMQRISKCLGVPNRPFSIVRNGADYSTFSSATPEWFVSTYGIKDFVLCVGRIEARKNQAMLLYSLRESNVPIVLVGQTGEPDYEKVCRALAPPGTPFINQLNRNELASAYAAAKVCVLPSWAEGASLSNLEAAAACCPLVVSNRA
jgi:glycosyltransferase involved in cell wall biosynthesis